MANIPAYPQFGDITLEHAEEVRTLLGTINAEVAEFSFSNLFLFRHAHEYRLSRWQDFLLITGKGYDQQSYAFPPLGKGDVHQAVSLLVDHLQSKGLPPVFFPVPDAWLESLFPGPLWTPVADRNQADYLYLREDLATLPGKKFQKRRNRLKKFLREEAAGYQYAELADEYLPQCLELADGWCDIRCSLERPSTYQETQAVKEALQYYRLLGLRGGVILIAGRVRAFCLGEPLNRKTFVVHFEKTEPGRTGLAQIINRDFCQHSLGAFIYVNREQDLGDAGLRQAKMSYNPVCLLEKNCLTLEKSETSC
ncbi:MAG: DUF2156 domain-containing protein [Deltaproteobacteria bacterium]|nr:DUF2156 domain-containing protein [Candidatus Anaeroferrophillus wilburensis]MBN2887784.1 DUF2156 domain-containing protein [Deltaproteobacteria bacterium]